MIFSQDQRRTVDAETQFSLEASVLGHAPLHRRTLFLHLLFSLSQTQQYTVKLQFVPISDATSSFKHFTRIPLEYVPACFSICLFVLLTSGKKNTKGKPFKAKIIKKRDYEQRDVVLFFSACTFHGSYLHSLPG